MARRTVLLGGDVARWLPGRLNSVVTRFARCGDARMVEPRDRPLSGVVATVAARLGGNVVGGFAFCAHGIVAARALLRGAGKDAVLVAGFATDCRMGAGQREAGAEVIEIDGKLGIARTGWQRCHQQRHEHRQDRQQALPGQPANPSNNDPTTRTDHVFLDQNLNGIRNGNSKDASRTAAARSRFTGKFSTLSA